MSKVTHKINKYLNEQDDGALSSKEKKAVMTAIQDVLKDSAMNDIADQIQKYVDMDEELLEYVFSVYEEATSKLFNHLKRHL
jgi:methionine aminopeptidase